MYEYKGYFIRQNVWVGRRARGGYECELDIVAFHPANNRLVQIEPSMDASSWKERERRYEKKFEAGRKYIPELFQGLRIPTEIEQIAVLVFASKQNHKTLAGGKIVLVSELLTEILTDLRDKAVASMAIPEQHPILRTLQFVAQYKTAVFKALSDPGT